MIAVPTAPWTHVVFDGVAWSTSIAFSVMLYRWRLRDEVERVATRVGAAYFASLAIGAIAGAWVAGSFNTLRGATPELSHSIAGALVGAITCVELFKAIARVRGSTGTVFVGSFSLGVVIGRLGCLFAGLPDQTYGTPTRLPWGVDLGDGISRHPVQIYESLAMAIFLALYLRGLHHRERWAYRRSFYAMCAWYGLQRFAWEFLKPYPALLGPLNLFHMLSVALVIYGLSYGVRDYLDEQRARRRAISVPGSDHQPV